MKKYYEYRKSDYIYNLLIILSIVLLYFAGQWLFATGLLLAFAIALFYFNSLYTYKKKRWERFVVNILTKMSNTVTAALEKSSIPIVLVRESGEIIWYNKETLELFKEKHHNFRLEEITPDYKSAILGVSESNELEIKVHEKDYQVLVIPVKHQESEFEENLRIVVFHDISMVKEAEAKITSVLSIEVDNYSDLLNSVDSEKKPFLLAEIENYIYSYGHELKAMVRKYESNKFMMVVPEYYIHEQIRKKFPVLDHIKSIHQGNSIEPTLSIGIGKGGRNPEENQSLSKAAKELALGRGGDQVVIKTPTNLSFYGGSSKEIEKKSRVRSRVVAHALEEIIKDSHRVYIMGHRNPDMDCFGSAVGIKVIARGLGKKAVIINEEPYLNIRPIYDKFIELSEYKEDIISLERAKAKVKREDTLIIVDVHARNHVLSNDIISMFDKVVIIDHISSINRKCQCWKRKLYLRAFAWILRALISRQVCGHLKQHPS